jgi:hypothetical protein
MKFLKNAPLLALLLVTGILLTAVGFGGKSTIYKEQSFTPLEEPLLSLVFTGIHDKVYPWQMLDSRREETFREEAFVEETLPEEELRTEETANTAVEQAAAAIPEQTKAAAQEQTESTSPAKAEAAATALPAAAKVPKPTVLPSPTPVPYGEGRPEPLRESTKEEAQNHISADIYGDMGTIKAAEYTFQQVDESYFDDALFIGDSRTVGLRDYTDLSEHADFCCETSLTIYGVMGESYPGIGTVKEALAKKTYGKIYLMVGINELGRGTTEDFLSKYTQVVDEIHELAPEAKIIVQAVMRVSAKKDESDALFNNSNINARNNAIATLADNEHIFYIDMNEAVCDEDGNLIGDYTFDQIHLLGMYNDLWKQFLLNHGV